MKKTAVILTHNRPEALKECIAAIRPQVDWLMVLDNASDPPVQKTDEFDHLHISLRQPPSLGDEWNLAFEFMDAWFPDGCDIAVLCDDAIVPPMWFDAVTHEMRNTGAVLGCSNPWGTPHPPHLKLSPDNNIAGRMPGWAWIIDSRPKLRANNKMKWWWVDTDLDFRARLSGGMVMIGGFAVPNTHPGEFTNTRPELGEQVGRDAEEFVKIWGSKPW